MARYINVSGLPNFEVACSDGKKYVLLPFERLSDIPTANVVEVVRCKDCIYSKKYNYLESEERYMCERKFVRHGIYKKPVMLEVSKDDFCSFGEKKKGD